MTREEAITILKDISWQMGSVKRWENIEAIDMAIEALSADRNILDELQRRFEEEEHKAFENDKTGLKEHVVWNRAIRILEEYME